MIGALLITVVLRIGYFWYASTGNPCNSMEKTEIQNKIETIIRIKYGWDTKKKISGLTTKKFQENMDPWSFYEGIRFYAIDKNFMETYREKDIDCVQVDVNVYAPDITVLIITLTKTQKGEFLISNIEYDI